LTALPPDFLARAQSLEASYLQSDDPIRQSGFGGGAERWRAEREPILEAIEADGDLLDIGCANGYLLECLVAWGAERGLALTPFGVDIGPALVAEAKRRQPESAHNFWVANAWDWRPPRRFRYVYTLYDIACPEQSAPTGERSRRVPEDLLAPYVQRLLERVVEPGGRLIVGAYGSRSRGTPPFDIAGFLEDAGYRLVARTMAGEPPIVAFAWVDNRR
jgi:SAM-dependent methyltransferase